MGLHSMVVRWYRVEPAGRTCLMLMPGFHASSSFKMDKHTVPDGYTFGWIFLESIFTD